MKVIVCPADRGGCGYYRMIWPAEALRAEGHDVEILTVDDNLCRGAFIAQPGGVDKLVELIDPPDVDVVILQRCLNSWQADMVPLLQAHGIAVVVEVDDDFTRIDRRNIAHDVMDPVKHPERNYEHLLRACAAADLVTVSTPALAGRFAPHGRVVVVPNCVPARYLNERHDWSPDRLLHVGWTGSLDTHPGDLESTDGAIGDVMRASAGAAQFVVIGTGLGVQHALDLPNDVGRSGWLPIEQYPHAVAQLDVGVVPLRACAFNRAKSWLKGLEMAAVGVPFVASATPEYERLAKHGAGVLAGSARDWSRELGRLIADRAWRDEVADRGRQVAARFTIERNASRWWGAWAQARAMRHAA